VKVKDHGVIVADRTFTRWNEAEAWEADRKRMVATGRLAPASAGRTPLGARVGIGWEPAGGDGLDLKVVVVPMGEAGRLILGPCPCESW